MPGAFSNRTPLKEGPILDCHPLSRRGRKLGEKWRRKGYSVRYRVHGRITG